MSITSGNSASVVSAAKPNTTSVKAEDNRGIKDMAAQAKQAQNVAILRANEQVSLRSNNDSLSLLYKTALEGINAELEPVMGENAAQKIYDSGIDTSPEATADRIVAFATGFYSRYKELNPGKSEEETLDSFMQIIGGGIEKGFSDAKDILKGLKVYEGEVESGVDKTYGLVMQGLNSFREKMLELAANTAQPDDSAEV
jgi:tRNA splicing ligase